MNKQPYPYCKHGVYVGGCGIDYMCGACEMGDDEDPSPNDIVGWINNLNAKMDENVAKIEGWYLEGNVWRFGWPKMYATLLRDDTRKLREYERELAEARRWATNGDDTLWGQRRYEAQIKEWHQMDGSEQFNNLPFHVLDGSY